MRAAFYSRGFGRTIKSVMLNSAQRGDYITLDPGSFGLLILGR